MAMKFNQVSVFLLPFAIQTAVIPRSNIISKKKKKESSLGLKLNLRQHLLLSAEELSQLAFSISVSEHRIIISRLI